MDGEAPLLVDVQQGRDSIPVELCPGAEHKDLLHPLVLELLWWEKTSNADARVCENTQQEVEKADIWVTLARGSSYQCLSPDSCGCLCICNLNGDERKAESLSDESRNVVTKLCTKLVSPGSPQMPRNCEHSTTDKGNLRAQHSTPQLLSLIVL